MSDSTSRSYLSMPGIGDDAGALLQTSALVLRYRVSQQFSVLIVLQFVGLMLLTLFVTPRTWIGLEPQLHLHVTTAVVLGGWVSAVMFIIARGYGETWWAPHAIGGLQALMTALLIHVTGGRIETHFHAFVSLAALAAYRDWRVLIVPTVVIALDHIVRGIWFPESVFGVLSPDRWRWVEHSLWVLLIDACLTYQCWRGEEDLKLLTQQQAELSAVNTTIEREVAERTRELEEARDRALASDRLKSQFLANISHEVRTPLNGILGFAEILRASKLPDDQEAHVRSIASSSEGLLAVLNDVLDLAKLEAGSLELAVVDVDLESLVTECVATVRDEAERKGLALQILFDDALRGPLVKCDSDRMRQVLHALLANAVKFTESGRIEVECRAGESEDSSRARVQWLVRDTGVGIPADQVEAVFEPFVLVDGSTSRRHQGGGLGLAIVRGLVERMGGTIHCSSEVGEGSCFVLTIEFDRAAGRSDGPLPSGATDRESSPRVLIADDNAVNLRMLEVGLARFGFEIETAVDGQEALDACTDRSFDLVLMDVQMPGLDGIGATRRIRGECGHQPVILALTAHATTEDKQTCLDAGMDGYLTKPIRLPELARQVRSWLAARDER